MRTIEVSDEEYEAFMTYTAVRRLLGTPMKTVIRVDAIHPTSVIVTVDGNPDKRHILWATDTLTLYLE